MSWCWLCREAACRWPSRWLAPCAAPLEVFTVRKLGVPGQEELAMGAIATGGIVVLNQEVVQMLNIPQAVIERAIQTEGQELARREAAYRDDRPLPAIAGKTVILVDDGLATGTTMPRCDRRAAPAEPGPHRRGRAGRCG